MMLSLTAPSIAVLGAGSWGTALALTLARNGCQVKLWEFDRTLATELQQQRKNLKYLPDYELPDNLQICIELRDCLANATAIFLVVPSHAVRQVLLAARPYTTTTQGICIASKGLEPASGKFLHHVVEDVLGERQPLAILSGPSFAKEVAAQKVTALALATHHHALQQTLQQTLQSDRLRIYPTQDLIGVQLGGTVKNVLAIAAGIAEGLALGANAHAALITRGLAEMLRLGQALGAEPKTLIGLAGLGDLILTCSDNQSRNRCFGLAIGQGLTKTEALAKVGQTVEGERNSQELYQLATTHQVDMPIATEVYRILFSGLAPEVALRNLLMRNVLAE